MEKGMTLLEVVVSLFIFLLLLAGAVTFLRLTLGLQANVIRRCDTEQNCRLILEQLSKDLQRAEGLVQVIGEGEKLALTFKEGYATHQITYYYLPLNQELIRDDNGSSSPLTDAVIIIPCFAKENSRLLAVQLNIYPSGPYLASNKPRVVKAKFFLRNGWL